MNVERTHWKILLTFACVFAIIAAINQFIVLHWYAGSDEDIFSYVGYAWHRGDLPYINAFENKPPGIFLFWKLVWDIGGNLITARTAGVIVTLVSAIIVTAMAWRMWKSRYALIAGPVFLILMYLPSSDYALADTETFGIFFSLAAISLAWPLGRRIDIKKAIASGVLCGCAVLFKPQFGIEAIVVLALLARGRGKLKHRIAQTSAGVVSILLLIFACIGYFNWRGILADFVDVAIRSTALPGTVPSLYQRVIGLEFCLTSLSVPLVGAGIVSGFAVLHKSKFSGKEEIVRLLFLWFCGAMFGILMQGWCWAHQFKQIYPPLALLLPGIFCLYNESENVYQEKAPVMALILVIFALMLSSVLPFVGTVRHLQELSFSHNPDNGDRVIEKMVAEYCKSSDRIWCYPRSPSSIYINARRLSAARHFDPIFLSSPEARGEVMRALNEGKAKLVLLDWERVRIGEIDRSFNQSDRQGFHHELRGVLAKKYRDVGVVEGWQVYVYK